ncbi:MAG: hypothetical protein QW568_05345 [Candidatus Anstonellaceae archaeon]
MATNAYLILLAAALLLIFGCTAEQQPSSSTCSINESACGEGTVFNSETCKCNAVSAAQVPAQQPDSQQPPNQNGTNDAQEDDGGASSGTDSATQNVERTGTGVSPGTGGTRQPSEQISCTLKLDPETINPGDFTLISYDTYSEREVKFQYTCGEQIISISNGGLVSGAKLCQYNKNGVYAVRITANNATCAEKNLTVGQGSSDFKNCYIDQQSIKRNLLDYRYEARVYFTGGSSGEVLSWQCDRTTANKTLRDVSGFGMQLYEDIYCDFPSKPESESIPVVLGSFACGSISTR